MRRLVLAVVLFGMGVRVARADGVYLGLGDRGLLYFDGKQLTTITAKPAAVTTVLGTATTLWIWSALGGFRVDHGKLIEDGLRIALHARMSPSGTPWFGNEKEVSWYDGEWKTLRLPKAVGGPMLAGLEIDDGGRTWILRGGKLFFTRGDRWTGFAPPNGPADLRACKIAARGDLYLACWENVFRLHDNAWSSIAKLDKVAPQHVAVAADGRIYIDLSREVIVLTPGTADQLRFAAPRDWVIRTFAVDDGGRVWIGSEHGLAVFSAAGKPLELPRPLRGSDDVRAILVEGAGPTW